MVNKKNLKKALDFLSQFPGYSRKSVAIVSKRTGITDVEAIEQARRTIRREHYPTDTISAHKYTKIARAKRKEKRAEQENIINHNFKRLFFDVETSYCTGWFWRPSYKTSISYNQIFQESKIICICYKFEGDKDVSYLTWDKGCDKKMMDKFFKIINEADECISHNGNNFDVKWIRTRFLTHGYTSMPEIKSIDTLRMARTKFKFNSNKLNDIGITLGLGKKIDTGGIDLWHDIILRNDKIALKKMVEYCQQDVILLEKIFLKIKGFSPVRTHRAVQIDGERYDCPECTSINVFLQNTRTTSFGVLQRQMCCKDCGTYYKISNKSYMDYLQKKRDIRAMSLAI